MLEKSLILFTCKSMLGSISVFYLRGCCLLIKSFVKARGPLEEAEHNTARLSL